MSDEDTQDNEDQTVIARMDRHFIKLNAKIKVIDERTEVTNGRVGRIESIVDGDEVQNRAGMGERMRHIENRVSGIFRGMWVVGTATAVALIKGFWTLFTTSNP